MLRCEIENGNDGQNSSSAPPALCVWGVAVKYTSCRGQVSPGDWDPVLWRCVELCAGADISHSKEMKNKSNERPALALLDVEYTPPFFPPMSSVFSAENMPAFRALAQRLEVLRLSFSDVDEADGHGLVGAVAVFAHLREFSFRNCVRLSSIHSLQGCCDFLAKVDVSGCSALDSIEGLEGHLRLREVTLCGTAITSIAPLGGCPALVKVNVGACLKLKSLAGLEGHAMLQEVNASGTLIPSVRALLWCRNLKKLTVGGCSQLASLEGVDGHAQLEEVIAGNTPLLTSLRELRGCSALKRVNVRSCEKLISLDGLQDHAMLVEVDASHTAITSVRALQQCGALQTLYVGGCDLNAVEVLPRNAEIYLW